jgi:hypothetical protein
VPKKGRKVRRDSDVKQALLDKGMVSDESHHHMLRLHVDGVTTLVTRLSHGRYEVDDHLAKLMANQCALQLREFWRLVDCPLDGDQWVLLVRERCKDGRNPFMH